MLRAKMRQVWAVGNVLTIPGFGEVRILGITGERVFTYRLLILESQWPHISPVGTEELWAESALVGAGAHIAGQPPLPPPTPPTDIEMRYFTDPMGGELLLTRTEAEAMGYVWATGRPEKPVAAKIPWGLLVVAVLLVVAARRKR